MIQTVRTIEELSDISFLHETHPGSRCYRVHDPILAFAKAMLLSSGRGEADERKPKAEGEEEEEEDAQNDEKQAAAATRARKAALVSQARYLSRVNTLLRFSGGGSGTSVGETEAARRCGETVLLGGLPALAALWQSLEDVRRSGGGCDWCSRDQEDEASLIMAATGPVLERAYGASLEGIGVCVEAASGYWAASKLMQLQVGTETGVYPDNVNSGMVCTIGSSQPCYSACFVDQYSVVASALAEGLNDKTRSFRANHSFCPGPVPGLE